MSTVLLRCLALWCLLLPLGSALRAAEGSGEISAEFRQAMARAVDRFNARDFPEAQAACDALEKLQPSSPAVLNLRGAIALEQRHFDDGATYCQKAIDVDPKYFPARFNLAEIPFLQKQYREARDIYEVLQAEDPKNELLQYRIFLTYLLEGNEAAAEDTLKKVHFPGDTAAYYFAHAAWEYQHGHAPEGESWVNSANWVFSKSKNIYFADVFYDLGWLKRPTTVEEPADLRLTR